jgi:hypothetical protein
LAGLKSKVLFSVESIDLGRKCLATDGREHEGRLFYEDGISTASIAFQEASNRGSATTADPQTIIETEYTFLQQELQLCNEADIDTQSSLTQAVQSFKDALLSLEAVEDTGYKIVDKTYPHSPKYRVQGFPKDSFHIACIAHRTRLRNILRAPGINMIEKAVLQQRAANMIIAQNAYIEKQRATLLGK